MSVRHLFIAMTIFSLITSVTFASASMQKVEYLSDSITEKNGKVIGLLGGSTWELALPTLALPTDDIIIVFEEVVLKNNKKVTLPIAYLDGLENVASHIAGRYITTSGFLTTVTESLEDGAVLKLADGSTLSIPQYDRFDTGWWIPPYKVLLTGNRMYMWNLRKGKRVWIDR